MKNTYCLFLSNMLYCSHQKRTNVLEKEADMETKQDVKTKDQEALQEELNKILEDAPERVLRLILEFSRGLIS